MGKKLRLGRKGKGERREGGREREGRVAGREKRVTGREKRWWQGGREREER